MRNNTSRTVKIQARVAVQTRRLLDELSAYGLYGPNRSEVAGRFIEAALLKLMDAPRLKQRRGVVEALRFEARRSHPKLPTRRRRSRA